MKKVREVMTRDVESVSPTDTVRRAAGRMIALGLPALPVCLDGALVGVLTDRGITARIAAARRDPAVTLVREVMDVEPDLLRPERGLRAAERALTRRGSRFAFVVDGRRRLVGCLFLGPEKAAGSAASRPRKRATG